jgi:uncharacterized protein
VKYVTFYEWADDAMDKFGEHMPGHQARWAGFRETGDLLMIGPFTDLADGAIAVFATREAADEFVRTDPFVLHGVVRKWRILEWMEALVPDAPDPDPAGAPS